MISESIVEVLRQIQMASEKEAFMEIGSTLNLNGRTYNDLSPALQRGLDFLFKAVIPSPPCSFCRSSDHVRFRYFNNRDKARSTLQPRFQCSFDHPQDQPCDGPPPPLLLLQYALHDRDDDSPHDDDDDASCLDKSSVQQPNAASDEYKTHAEYKMKNITNSKTTTTTTSKHNHKSFALKPTEHKKHVDNHGGLIFLLRQATSNGAAISRRRRPQNKAKLANGISAAPNGTSTSSTMPRESLGTSFDGRCNECKATEEESYDRCLGYHHPEVPLPHPNRQQRSPVPKPMSLSSVLTLSENYNKRSNFFTPVAQIHHPYAPKTPFCMAASASEFAMPPQPPSAAVYSSSAFDAAPTDSYVLDFDHVHQNPRVDVDEQFENGVAIWPKNGVAIWPKNGLHQCGDGFDVPQIDGTADAFAVATSRQQIQTAGGYSCTRKDRTVSWSTDGNNAKVGRKRQGKKSLAVAAGHHGRRAEFEAAGGGGATTTSIGTVVGTTAFTSSSAAMGVKKATATLTAVPEGARRRYIYDGEDEEISAILESSELPLIDMNISSVIGPPPLHDHDHDLIMSNLCNDLDDVIFDLGMTAGMADIVITAEDWRFVESLWASDSSCFLQRSR